MVLIEKLSSIFIKNVVNIVDTAYNIKQGRTTRYNLQQIRLFIDECEDILDQCKIEIKIGNFYLNEVGTSIKIRRFTIREKEVILRVLGQKKRLLIRLKWYLNDIYNSAYEEEITILTQLKNQKDQLYNIFIPMPINHRLDNHEITSLLLDNLINNIKQLIMRELYI